LAKIYYDKDCNLKLLDGKTIAVVGYGSQGTAHSNNLKDSGCDVIVAVPKGGNGWLRAKKDGFNVMTVADAAKAADVIIMLPTTYKSRSLRISERAGQG
jgi:ketol-acid reductoisomerase